MDLEFRELQRRYRAQPSWELGYRLLRLNKKITGEIINTDNLQLFTKMHLLDPFLTAIEKLHDHQYSYHHIQAITEDDEWDIWNQGVDYNVMIQDDEQAYQEGFIPSITENPFRLMVVLILKDDIQYGNTAGANFYPGFYRGSRPFSVAFGQAISRGLADILSHNTIYELRHHIRRNFDYSVDYIWDQPWGYQDVMMLPKDTWDEVLSRTISHLMLVYTFTPDEVLWNLLMDMEFGR